MRKFINIVSGFIMGIFPLVLVVIFGVLIYNELPNILGIIICVVLAIAAIWAGIKIFETIQRKGIIDFITVVKASPDFDNLNPPENSGTKKRTPRELAELSKINQNIFKGGAIKIFGDWFGKPYKNHLEINSIAYDEIKDQMIMQLAQNTTVTIDKPNQILESPTVLKILSAEKVMLKFQQKRSNSNELDNFFKSYMVVNNRIKTETNINGGNSKIDASIGEDAIIIFN